MFKYKVGIPLINIFDVCFVLTYFLTYIKLAHSGFVVFISKFAIKNKFIV